MVFLLKTKALTCGTETVVFQYAVHTHLVRLTRMVHTVVNVGLTVAAREAWQTRTRVVGGPQRRAAGRTVLTGREGTRVIWLDGNESEQW